MVKLEELRVEQLRKELALRNQPTAGIKVELRQRLREVCEEEGINLEDYEFLHQDGEAGSQMHATTTALAASTMDMNQLLAAIQNMKTSLEGSMANYSAELKTIAGGCNEKVANLNKRVEDPEYVVAVTDERLNKRVEEFEKGIETRLKHLQEKKPDEVVDVVKEQPEAFEVKVQEIDSKVEVEKVTDEEGAVKEWTIIRKKLKRKEGPKEVIIEIVYVKEEDQPEFEVTILTSEVPEASEAAPQEVKAIKKNTVKNVKKDDMDDYIQKLIEQEIPKTELEEYEKVDVEMKEKPKKIKKKKPVEKVEEKPVEEIEEILEDLTVKITDSEVVEEKPEHNIQISEELSELPVTVKEFEEAPKKPKKKKKMAEKPEEATAEEEEEVPEEFVIKVQEIAQKVEVEQVVDEDGVMKEQKVIRRTFKKKQGPKEEIIEVISVQVEEAPL